MSRTLVDTRDALRRATREIEARRYPEALNHLWTVLEVVRMHDDELRSCLRMLAACYQATGRSRALSTIHLFLGNSGDAERVSNAPLDRARVATARKNYAQAAQHFEAAGWLGHAAIQFENAGNDRGARVLWERLADDARLKDDLYTAGLVRFNAARAAARLSDRDAARRGTIECMHLLCAAADQFEARGLRERAFDCWNVVLAIGREGRFENLAEGYLNSIRILREDGLWRYALTYYEDFQDLAVERRELHAAATLYREASEYCRRQSLRYGASYRLRGAETHALSGEQTLTAGGTAEMAENAFAAAIDAWSELGLYSKVRQAYARLATLDLPDKRKARYARLSERLAQVEDDRADIVPFPDAEKGEKAYPEVWRLDVLEWEQGGDAAETMAELMLDPRVSEPSRVRALVARLWQLGQIPPGQADARLGPEALASLAGYLGMTETYVALAPLEVLVQHTDPRVRIAVMRAVGRLYFKRSFVAVSRALIDASPEVRAEAIKTLDRFHFRHAFDPLSRIFRETRDPAVRRAALKSLGKVQSVEALELLIEVLRHGDPADKGEARDLLVRADHADANATLRRAAAAETGPIRQELDRILKARGG
jgi:HEAT repeat protein